MVPTFLVVVNPNAGRVSGALVDAARRGFAERASQFVVTSSPEDVGRLLDHLGDRCPVIMGGDGSLNVMVNALHERGLLDRPLGLIPAGTANAFAQGLGLPLDPEDAARRLSQGQPSALDVLVSCDGRVAVNDVHTGVGSATPKAVALAKRVLGPLAYPVVNAATALATPGWPVQVWVDGRLVADQVVLAVAVGNGPVIGDGTALWPGADPGDGFAEITVIPAPARWRRPPLALAVIKGRHPERTDVVMASGVEVHIVGGPGAHNADGEQWPGVHDATYRIQRGALRLLR